jgi:hypothetical protein
VSAVMKATRRNGVPDEVHALLTLWGNWTGRHREHGPSGFPKESPFVKSALYGKLGIPQESNVRLDDDSMPRLVEWMETIISAMPADVAHLKQVILTKYKPYVNPIGNEPTQEAMAASLGMSLSTFRNRLESAQWYVYARMYP